MVTLIDEVVAKQHGKGLVTNMCGSHQHGMAEASGVSLPYVMDLRQLAGLLNACQPRLVAFGLQRLLELDVAVEVVLEGPLVASGDEQHIGEASVHRFFDDVLDGWLVDDGQHLFGNGLRGRQEPGAESGGRNHRFRGTSSHGSESIARSWPRSSLPP